MALAEPDTPRDRPVLSNRQPQVLLLGAGEIDVLLLTLLLGIVAGTYSSIFIASQILVSWEDGDFARLWRWMIPWRRVPAEATG